MKRLHVHVGVVDLNRSIAFYSTLFGAEPAATKPDYAKWMLDGEATVYGDSPAVDTLATDAACCDATTPQGVCCEVKPELAPEAPCCAPA